MYVAIRSHCPMLKRDTHWLCLLRNNPVQASMMILTDIVFAILSNTSNFCRLINEIKQQLSIDLFYHMVLNSFRPKAQVNSWLG